MTDTEDGDVTAPRRRPQRWTVLVNFRIPADLDVQFRTLYDGVDRTRSQAARKAFMVGVERLVAEREAQQGIYRTKGGRILTDTEIEALADDAERGFG